MVRRAAKGKALWPALLATAAALLASTAQASLPSNAASSELLGKPALTAALANAEHADKTRPWDPELAGPSTAALAAGLEDRGFRVLDELARQQLASELSTGLENRCGADKPRPSHPSFGLFGAASRLTSADRDQGLASPSACLESEKLASGVKSWEPRVNIRRLRYFASISWQRTPFDHRARFYDPQTQTFLEPDPLGPVDSPNLYQAFSLDSFNVTDPFGLRKLNTEDRAKVRDFNSLVKELQESYAESGAFRGKELSPDDYEYALADLESQRDTYIQAAWKAREDQPIREDWGWKSDADPRPVTTFRPQPTEQEITEGNRKAYKWYLWTNQIPNDVIGILGAVAAPKMVQQQSRAAETLGNASQEGLAARPYSKPGQRPPYAPGQVEKTWNNAKQPDGTALDPYTERPLTWDQARPRSGQWDMGHLPGLEYWKLQKDYREGVIPPEEFFKRYQDPTNYRPEALGPNRGHKTEMP